MCRAWRGSTGYYVIDYDSLANRSPHEQLSTSSLALFAYLSNSELPTLFLNESGRKRERERRRKETDEQHQADENRAALKKVNNTKAKGNIKAVFNSSCCLFRFLCLSLLSMLTASIEAFC